MADEIIVKIIQLIPLLLLPGFYLYSPTSTSNKFYIFLILSLLATHSYFPEEAFAVYNPIKSFILGHPWETLSLAITAGIPLKYLQRKLRCARINATKWKYGYTDDPDI